MPVNRNPTRSRSPESRGRQLSGTAPGVAKISNLIWMDLAASAVVGTITGFESQDGEQLIRQRDLGDDTNVILGKRTVRRLVHRVGYSNILYAIPAMVIGAIAVLTTMLLAVSVCCGMVFTRLMKFYINQLCLGRAVAQWEHPDAAKPDATSKEWVKTAGKKILTSIPEMPSKDKSREHGSQTSVREELSYDRGTVGSYGLSPFRGNYAPVQQHHE